MNTDRQPGPLGEALRVWRTRLEPEAIGLHTYGERRRVSGLRREELAMLAGVSASYYTRLEQGQSRNASREVLDALATALRLDDAERAHLDDLAAGLRRRSAPRRPPVEHVDPALAELLLVLDPTPAVVLGRRSDVLAWNSTGHALLGGGVDRLAVQDPRQRPNMADLVFLDENQRELYVDWPAKARAVVGNLRQVAGQHPEDPLLASLIGRLSVASAEFARLWADHRVVPCATAVYELNHPMLRSVTVTQQSLRSLQSPDQVLVTCTSSDAASRQSLSLLAHLVGDVERSVALPLGQPEHH